MTQASVIRFFVLGLPVGLILGGVAAVTIYMKEKGTSAAGFGHVNRPVEREDLKRGVETLSQTIGSRHAGEPDRVRFTIKYLQGLLDSKNMGYPDTVYRVSQQSFKTAGEDGFNLVVEIPGNHPDHMSEIVLVGAHYDSAPGSPGADANATGVAAGLSLARAFAGTTHERILRFVFFANGDAAYAGSPERGSEVYALECRKRGEKIVAMLNLDSLGYYSSSAGSQKTPAGAEAPLPDAGNFLAFAASPADKPLVDLIHTAFAKENTLPVANLIVPVDARTGDEGSFVRQGYPAVTITDTGSLRNPNCLLPGDTTGTIDYERFTQAVRGLQTVLRQLANPVRSGGT